jgi:hypothetical protein
MQGYVIFAIIIVILSIVALAITARVRKQRLERRIRVELTNQGNIGSRYELRGDDPDGVLAFHFALRGDTLPVGRMAEEKEGRKTGLTPVAAPTPEETGKPGAGLQEKAGEAMGCSNSLLNMLLDVSLILPSSIRAPVMRVASQMRRGQTTAYRIQRVPQQAARIKRVGSRAPVATSRHEAAVSRITGPLWAQTPSVAPGETLSIDMLIRPIHPGKSRTQPYRLFSRSVEQGEAEPAIQEGTVQIWGGFWTLPYAPYLTIAGTAIALLVVAYWLTSNGALTW